MGVLGLEGLNSGDYNTFAESRRSTVLGIQQLGAQVRQDFTRLMVNRDVKALAQEMQNVNPQSPDFPQQLVGLMSNHPLAVQSPIGNVAINQLGAQHKSWLSAQQKMEPNYRPFPGTNSLYDTKSGTTLDTGLQLPEKEVKPVVLRGKGGATGVHPQTGKTLWQMGNPFEEDVKYKDTKVGRDIVRTFEDGTTRTLYSQEAKSRTMAQQKPLPEASVQILQAAREKVDKAASLMAEKESLATHRGDMYNAGGGLMGLGVAGVMHKKAIDEAVAAREAFEKAKAELEQLNSDFAVREAGLPQPVPPIATAQEPPSLMEGGGIPDNRPNYRPGKIYRDSDGRRARFTADGTWEPVK